MVGPHGVRRLPSDDGLPLGLGELGAAEEPFHVVRERPAPGETLLLVSDGVTEARDEHGVFHPLADDLAGAVVRHPRLVEPARLVAYVRDGTLRHCHGRLADDTTVFAVRRETPPSV